MKKLLIIFLSVSFFTSCKEDEIQKNEPAFDNYAKVLRIIEVSNNQIVLKNNTGTPVFAQEYIYQTRDTTVRLTTSTDQIAHQATYVVEAAKPIDFKKDTVFLKKIDFATLDTTVSDTFYPINTAGF